MVEREKIVNIEYVNARNIKTGIKLKNKLPLSGIVKVTTTRNSPAKFKYEVVNVTTEAKSISDDLICLKSL